MRRAAIVGTAVLEFRYAADTATKPMRGERRGSAMTSCGYIPHAVFHQAQCGEWLMRMGCP